jgi:hypothetical protein
MTLNWRPNPSAPLWDEESADEPKGPFFKDLNLKHIHQIGPTCVPTTLAMIARSTGADVGADDFKPIINSQSPHSWSKALEPYNLQLAYCNQDLRRLDYYIDELVGYNDLFLLCFYSVRPPSDPDANGKLCTAHIVTLHGCKIIDTAKSGSFSVVNANQYPRRDRETKRIFRVVPLGHPRRV